MSFRQHCERAPRGTRRTASDRTRAPWVRSREYRGKPENTSDTRWPIARRHRPPYCRIAQTWGHAVEAETPRGGLAKCDGKPPAAKLRPRWSAVRVRCARLGGREGVRRHAAHRWAPEWHLPLPACCLSCYACAQAWRRRRQMSHTRGRHTCAGSAVRARGRWYPVARMAWHLRRRAPPSCPRTCMLPG